MRERSGHNKIVHCGFIAALSLIAAGCGRGSSEAKTRATAPALDCAKPAEPNTLGVSLGMSPKQTINAVKCSDREFELSGPFNAPQGTDNTKYVLLPLQRGKDPVKNLFEQKFPKHAAGVNAARQVDPVDTLAVQFIGMPGNEWAYSIDRQDDNLDRNNPASVDAVKASFIARYGTPTFVLPNRGSYTLSWFYYPNGSPIPSDSQDYRDCSVVLQNRYLENYCGRLIQVYIGNDPNGAAVSVRVQMLDSSKAAAAFAAEDAMIRNLNSPKGAAPKF